MKEFKLEVDTNTIYFKIIRYLGTLLLGFTIGVLLTDFRNGMPIDWMNSFTLIFLSIVFSFYPGKAKFQYLLVNEDGISLLPEKLLFQVTKQFINGTKFQQFD